MYELEKVIWNQDDFSEMGWHDSNIYGFIIERNDKTFTADLVFDIDYIFSWIHPVVPETHFSFYVAPCTLIFSETFDLKIDIETGQAEFELEVSDLHLISKTENNGREIYEWNMELQQGSILFKSHGFEQVVRQNPKHVQQQILSFEERGGISFTRNSSCP